MGVEQRGIITENQSNASPCFPQPQTCIPQLIWTVSPNDVNHGMTISINHPTKQHNEMSQTFVLHSVQKTSGLFNTDLSILNSTKDTLDPISPLILENNDLSKPQMDMENIADLELEAFLNSYTDLTDLAFEATPASDEKSSASLTGNDATLCELTSPLTLDIETLELLKYVEDESLDKILLPSSTETAPSISAEETKVSNDNKGEEKITKYYERRAKNNVASQRSRQNRKRKEQEMEDTLKLLEKDNKRLKSEVELLEDLVKRLRGYVIEKLSSTK